jgi:ADP-ribose pyrophosphatase YjhB (NUDIX family)
MMPEPKPAQIPPQAPATVRNVARPQVGVSVVVFTLRPTTTSHPELAVLLVRRDRAAYRGRWALPGGWVHEGSSLTESARWQLLDKTGLEPDYLEQLYTFGRPDRDPREHRIAVTYFALVRWGDHHLRAGPGTSRVDWFDVDNIPTPLAFDNEEIIAYGLRRLRNKVDYAHLAFRFLQPEFTMAELRTVYEAVLGQKVDPPNFRRKVAAAGTVVSTDARQRGVPHRPALLYRCSLSIDELLDAPPA